MVRSQSPPKSASALDAWLGPGVLVFNGNTFEPGGDERAILAAHPRLSAAVERFLSDPGRQVLFLGGPDGTADAAELRITAHRRGRAPVRVEPGERFGPDNDEARAEAERLIGDGYAGLITGHAAHPELTSLGEGFYANNGSGGIVVVLDRDDGGGPILSSSEVSWIELEAGADLHVRLLHFPRRHLPCGGRRVPRRSRLAGGGLRDCGRRRARDKRRDARHRGNREPPVAAPPLRGRFDIPRDLLPISVPETASAVVAAAGIALLGLSWGVRRGQRRAWLYAVAITALSAVLHVVKGLDVEEAVVAFAVLGFLIAKRRAFTAVGERPSIGRELATLAGGAACSPSSRVRPPCCGSAVAPTCPSGAP